MLCVNKKGLTINTRDFIQDHSGIYDEIDIYEAKWAIQTNDLTHFVFENANPFGKPGPVRQSNLPYLRKILAEIRETK